MPVLLAGSQEGNLYRYCIMRDDFLWEFGHKLFNVRRYYVRRVKVSGEWV